jgi:hypothetical protein
VRTVGYMGGVVKPDSACLTLIPLLVLVLAVPAAAEEPPQEYPKLVLVLSGGGARGIAHIGGDTSLGPIILAYGRTEGNRDRFYLAIGDRV